MCNLAFVNKLKVVCRFDSGPSGTSPFNFSRHKRRWARRFFSISLWVDLLLLLFFLDLFLRFKASLSLLLYGNMEA